MIDLLFSPFADFSFMRRALFGCLMISLTAPVIGMLLVYRRMSLTGDAMSHAILPGVAVGYLIGGLSVSSMTIGGLIAGVTVIILSGFASKASKTAEDASLASFYLISLAAHSLRLASCAYRSGAHPSGVNNLGLPHRPCDLHKASRGRML